MHNHAAPGVNGVSSHAPGVNLGDNRITGNQISGNGADNDDPLSPGATGISIFSLAAVTGTVISQNTFTSSRRQVREFHDSQGNARPNP